MRAFLLLTVATAALAVPALADVKGGVEAWERGDYKIAVDQWRAAALQGDADAMFNLGQAYKLGRGVPADTWKAQDYYRQASERGHVVAADNYGLALFQNGKPQEAIPYLEKAAERGDPRAQYIFGTMLFNGTDVARDWVRAYALLTRAERGGLSQAGTTLRKMDEFIPPEQRRAGEDMAVRMVSHPSPGFGAENSPAQTAEGDTGSGIRGLDLPPSQVAERPVIAAAVAAPAPHPAVAKPRPVTPVAKPIKPASKPAARLAATPPRPAIKAAAPAPATGNWRIQLGAFSDPGNARRLVARLHGQFPGRVVKYTPSGAIIRVTVGPFPSRAAALAGCGAVRPCAPVAP